MANRTGSQRRFAWWRLLVSATLLAYLLWRIPLHQVGAALAAAQPGWLLLAFALHFVGFLLSTIRWRLFLSSVLPRPPGLAPLVRAYMIGVFCNQFLPSTVGGDLYRSLDAARVTGLGRSVSLAIVFVERLVGALALFLYAAGAFLLGFGRFGGVSAVGPALAALAAVFLGVGLGLTPRGRRWAQGLCARTPARRLLPAVERASAAVGAVGRRPRVLLAALALSLLFQGNVVLHYLLVGKALGLRLPALAYFLVVPVVLLLLQLPVSLNGIGVREGAFVMALGPGLWGETGAPEARAFAFSLLVYAMIVLQGALGGVWFALRRGTLAAVDTPAPEG